MDQQVGARPVDTFLQSTELLSIGVDEVWVTLGWTGEAEVVDERRAAAASARSL